MNVEKSNNITRQLRNTLIESWLRGLITTRGIQYQVDNCHRKVDK